MAREFTSLYVHVPFCGAKCDYCAFYSVAAAPPGKRRAYLERLDRELVAHAPRCGHMESVYIGGGTPSFLDAPELDALLRLVRVRLTVAESAELTVECNPDSLTREKVALLARHEVNRVSLGIQSFQPALRATLGRRGSLDGLDEKLNALRAGGIDNIGFDLIYAIPGQTLDDWRADLRRACAAGIRHLSTYELTAEEGTALARRRMPEAAADLAVEMWTAAAEVAAADGFHRYEVSNLAQEGRECRHNQHVWHGGTYLGCGPAASSFDGALRWTNPPDLEDWLAGAPPDEDRLRPAERAAEVLAIGFRTACGWARGEFLDRTGLDYFHLRGDALAGLVQEGLLEEHGDAIRPTTRGLLFADYVARKLL